MPKHCAILKCPTDKDRQRRTKLGLKQLTLFRIPKGKNALEAWSEAIEQKLSSTDYLCERHFTKDSIRKEYKTPMPDGTVHVLARDRYALVRGAIPNTIDNYDDNEDIIDENRIDSSKVVANDINDLSNQSVKNSESISNHNEVERDDIIQKSQDASGVPNNSIGSTNDRLETNPGKSDHEEEYIDFTEDDHRQQEANCSIEPDLIELDNAVDFNKAIIIKNKIQKSKKRGLEKPKPLTIGDVFPHLEGIVLPETWAWINNRFEESNTFLIQLNRDTMESRLRLILHEDYSVTLCTADGKVHIKLQSRVTSIPIMTELLGEVGRMMVCEGSGMEEDSRADDCSGIVGPREYSASVRIIRCSACRHLRKTMQSRFSRIKADFDTEFAQSKEELNLTRLSCRRLQRKDFFATI